MRHICSLYEVKGNVNKRSKMRCENLSVTMQQYKQKIYPESFKMSFVFVWNVKCMWTVCRKGIKRDGILKKKETNPFLYCTVLSMQKTMHK